MARFTTRIELHGASRSDYDNLHSAMDDEGFTRTVTSDDGTVYDMPWAEYNYDGNRTLQHVFDAGKRAASSTGYKFAILVTKSAGRKWQGLDKSFGEY